MKSLKNVLIREIRNDEIPKELKRGIKSGFIGEYYEPRDSEIPKPGTPLILYSQDLKNSWVIFGKTRVPSTEAKSQQQVEYTAICSHNRGHGFVSLTENFLDYINLNEYYEKIFP